MTVMAKLNWRFWNKSDAADIKTSTWDERTSKEDLPISASAECKENDKADIRLTLAGYYLVIFFGQEKRSTTRLAKERQEHPVLTYGNAPVLAFVWLSITFTLYSIVVLAARGVVSLLS